MDGGEPQTAGRAAARRRGRPALGPEAREERILDALERLMAEKGLHGASMAAVARAAGMSKRTVYAVFESRDALFAAWVRRLRASLVRPLPEAARTLPIAERLRLLLRREAAPEASARRLTALRAVIAEAPRNPALADAFRREGPEAGRAIVAEELARAAAAGEIALDAPGPAAALLFDMATPNPVDRLLDPAAAPLCPEVAEARLALAIAVFLRGVAAGRG